MATPEDSVRQQGGPPDERPRRQPPTIDVKAVEVPLDAPNAASAESDADAGPTRTMRSLKQFLASLSSMRAAVIGLVCAIVLMVAGALWIYLIYNEEPTRDLAGSESAKPDVIEHTSKLETGLDAPPAQALSDTELANRTAILETRLGPLAERVGELERSVRNNAAAARTATERADKLAALFNEAKKSGDEQNSLQQRDRRSLEGLADRLKALEAAQMALRQKGEELDRAANATAAPDRTVRAAVIAAALRNAVERDDPFTVELAAARSLGLDEKALASLEPFAETGLPKRSELLGGLAALVPELLRAGGPSGHDLSYLDRLQASAAKMLNIRPVRDEPGDDPTTVIGRIEFKITQQDLAGVIADLDKLPAPARELAQPWRTKILARQGAIEAARLIATGALAKLGEPAVRGPSPQ
jgi:hypothetical protein